LHTDSALAIPGPKKKKKKGARDKNT